MRRPKYSFIVPVLNGERTLERTLRSIQNQTLRNFELIVVDNGSTDGTAAIARRPGAIYLHHRKRGRARARNAGVLKSRGQYLAFVDADVQLNRNWLEQADRFLRQVPVDALTTRIVPGQSGNRSLDRMRRWSTAWKTRGSFLNLYRPKGGVFPLVNTAACIVSKESFSAVGGFDERLKRHEDLDLSLRLFSGGFLLGGASRARSIVRFESGSSLPWAATAAYFKRAYEVNQHSLFRPSRVMAPNGELLRYILKNGGNRAFLLAAGVELASFGGRLTRKLQGGERNWDHKPGPNAVRFSFSLSGRTYVLKQGLNLVFVDRGAYVLTGLSRSHRLNATDSWTLLGLLNDRPPARARLKKLSTHWIFRELR